MIRPLQTPINPLYQLPTERSPGRYEGLFNFAMKLGGIFGSPLKEWTVLDVGGADGWLGEMLVCRRYFCLDLRHDKSWSGFLGLGEDLPIKDQAVDVVVSKQTLPHFVDPVRACQEMIRVARHGLVIRQEFPESPIGWPGHSRVQIDSPLDILTALQSPDWTFTYDGTDFIGRLT